MVARGSARHLGIGYDGVLELREPPPVYVSAVLRHVVLATEFVPEPVEEVTLIVPVRSVRARLARLRLRVCDASSGAPVVKATAELNDRQSGGGGVPVGEDGGVVFEDQRPGFLELVVRAADYELLHQWVRLEPGGDHDLGDVPLHPATSISGVVVGPDGRPLECRLGLADLDRRTIPAPLDYGWGAQSDSDGSFRVSNLGRGRYLIYPNGGEWARVPTVVDTIGGSVEGVRIALIGGTLLRLSLDPTIQGSVLTVADARGIPVGAWTLSGTRSEVSLRLAPGTYSWTLSGEQGGGRTESFRVGTYPTGVSVTP